MPPVKRSSDVRRENQKSRKTDTYESNTLFSKLLKDCGVTLMNGGRPNTMKIEQSAVLNDMYQSVANHVNLADVVEKVLHGMKDYIKDKNRFVRMMLTTELVQNESENDEVPKTVQDSVMRLMLKTPPLQSGVAEILIEKMIEFKSDITFQLSDDFEQSESDPINIPQLILNQLRWLDVMDDANKVALSLLDAASKMPHQSGCCIIGSLPEIIGDQVQCEVVDQLKNLLASHAALTIPILETLSSLNCSVESLSNLVKTIFSCIGSVKVEELPIVIKFLLHTMNPNNALNNIGCIRQHLTFSPASLSQRSRRIESNEATDMPSIILTAESILHAAQFRPLVADTWIKVLKDLKENEPTPADFVTIILLCTNCNVKSKKAAITLLKSKVLKNAIDDDLVQTTFRECRNVLIQYFATVSDLASQFVSSNNTTLRDFGGMMYLFMLSYMDATCQEEVMRCLIQHVGSFCQAEADSALRVLKVLADDKLSLIAQYASFIKEMIDHIERLEPYQIRQIYGIMSKIAFAENQNSLPSMAEEIHMAIRKQLTSSSTKFKHIGIIGAVSALSILGQKDIIDDKKLDKANSILNLLTEITSSDNKTQAYYFDELCHAPFSKIESRLRNSLFSMVQNVVSKRFLRDDTQLQDYPTLKKAFAIQQNSSQTIPVYFSVQSCDFSQSTLCPIFKAFFRAGSKSQLDKIYDIASLPVLLHQSVYDLKEFKLLTPSEQKFSLDSLFVTLNLFREHINAFCSKKSEHDRLLLRINQAIEVEGMIDSLASSVLVKYNPPVMVGDFSMHVESTTTGLASRVNTQDESSANVSQMRSPEAGGISLKKSKAGKRKNDPVFSVQSLKSNYFRELTPGLLHVLEIPMAENPFGEDSDSITSSSQALFLTPSQVSFILKDLKFKICHMLPSRDDEKRSPFASASNHYEFQELKKLSESDFGSAVCDLVPSLCNHLESVSGMYNGGGSDCSENLETDNWLVLASCYESLLEVIFNIIAWRGLKCNQKLLKIVLNNIAKRFSSDINEHSPMENLLERSTHYLKSFESTVTKVSLQAAVFIMKIFELLSSFSEASDCDELNLTLHEFSLSVLKNDWTFCYARNNPAVKKNDLLGYLLKMSLRTSNDIMKCAIHYVDDGLCKLTGDTGDIMYPNFQKSNSHVLYSGLLETMADETSRIPPAKTQDDESVGIEILLKWNDCMKVIGVIVKLLREHHSRINILSCLKFGRSIIENFIKNGMPTCEKLFQLYQDDIVSTLKHLQTTTRPLQNLTCHSKVTKDVSLAKQVPPLKKCLETLVFRVKAMLAFHNCQEAFWLGNLKNRNIQGEEILSQLTQQEYSDASSEYHDMSYSESY